MLAVAGVAVGHIAGYAIAHPDAAGREAALGGHAYLPVAASVIVPLGVLTALVWAVRTARTLHLAGRIDVRHLVVAQLAVFGCQEVAERLVSGAGRRRRAVRARRLGRCRRPDPRRRGGRPLHRPGAAGRPLRLPRPPADRRAGPCRAALVPAVRVPFHRGAGGRGAPRPSDGGFTLLNPAAPDPGVASIEPEEKDRASPSHPPRHRAAVRIRPRPRRVRRRRHRVHHPDDDLDDRIDGDQHHRRRRVHDHGGQQPTRDGGRHHRRQAATSPVVVARRSPWATPSPCG